MSLESGGREERLHDLARSALGERVAQLCVQIARVHVAEPLIHGALKLARDVRQIGAGPKLARDIVRERHRALFDHRVGIRRQRDQETIERQRRVRIGGRERKLDDIRPGRLAPVTQQQDVIAAFGADRSCDLSGLKLRERGVELLRELALRNPADVSAIGRPTAIG